MPGIIMHGILSVFSSILAVGVTLSTAGKPLVKACAAPQHWSLAVACGLYAAEGAAYNVSGTHLAPELTLSLSCTPLDSGKVNADPSPPGLTCSPPTCPAAPLTGPLAGLCGPCRG